MHYATKPIVYLMALIAGMGGFLFGFDTSVVADIQAQAMHQLNLTEWQWSKIVSSSILGCLLGIPLSGFFADRLSRSFLLKLVALGFIVGTLLCVLANNFMELASGRLIIGLCIGIASYITPLFIAEMAPTTNRGALILMNGLALTFGQAAAYLLGVYLLDSGSHSWRLLLALGIVPALTLWFGMLLLPKSPRWLFKHQGLDAARSALERLRNTQEEIQMELKELEACASRTNNYRLWAKPILPLLLTGTFLGIFQQFSGINAIFYYGPMIFTHTGYFTQSQGLMATFCLGMINFVFTGITLLAVDKLGRRTLLLSGTIIAAIAMSLASLQLLIPSLFGKYAFVLALSIYVMGYCLSVGSLFWVVIAEIFPMSVRGAAMSITTFVQWGANLVVSLSFLSLYQTLGQGNCLTLFALFCFMAFIFCYYFIPETSGISLEKIEQHLLSGKPLRKLPSPLVKPVLINSYGAEQS